MEKIKCLKCQGSDRKNSFGGPAVYRKWSVNSAVLKAELPESMTEKKTALSVKLFRGF
jgi:hypothetical protein